MPDGKNASYRYQVLDRCFSDFKHKYGIEELLDAVNEKLYDVRGFKSQIKERQLRDDINAVRKMLPCGVYLEAKQFDGKKCYYRYSASSFSIYQNELTVEEVQNLRSTIEMLGKYRGLPSNAWLEDVISNLEYRFGVKSNGENLISFGQNERLAGLEFLSKLIDCTVNHVPFSLTYRTYSGEEYKNIVHPYHMRQYNNRWFLLGLNAEQNKISIYALDRIVSVDTQDVRFIPNEDIDFSTYFSDIVGVSVPQQGEDAKIEDVILRFSPKRLPYVLSKPIHHTQDTLNDTDIVIRVYPTRELTQQILSFGDDVEVVSPDWYRKEISRKIEEIFKKYFPMHNLCIDNSDLCIVNPNKGGEMNVKF